MNGRPWTAREVELVRQLYPWTGAVYEGDDFDYGLGDSPFVKHRPGERGNEDEKDLRYVYAVGRVKGSDWPIVEVWPIAKVWKHRDRFNKVGRGHYSFTHAEMYARKVVLLQVLKYMPKSPELLAAMALDDGAARGQQGLTLKDAIEGTYAPLPEGGSTGDAAEEGVDRATGEIIPPEGTSAGLARAVADIKSAIERATTVEQVQLQQDMARNVKDDKLRGELDAAARAKLKELGETAGA